MMFIFASEVDDSDDDHAIFLTLMDVVASSEVSYLFHAALNLCLCFLVQMPIYASFFHCFIDVY